MVRWEPNSQSRLAQAALELFTERGYDATTIVEIAERAGLSERTFFRYFTDKREVLFWESLQLQEIMVHAVVTAAPKSSPLETLMGAQEAAAILLQERRAFVVRRHAVISSSPELQERELIKFATLASALAKAFRERGVDDATASLIAEIGITVFRVAYERWVDKSNDKDLARLIRKSMKELRSVTSGN